MRSVLSMKLLVFAFGEQKYCSWVDVALSNRIALILNDKIVNRHVDAIRRIRFFVLAWLRNFFIENKYSLTF